MSSNFNVPARLDALLPAVCIYFILSLYIYTQIHSNFENLNHKHKIQLSNLVKFDFHELNRSNSTFSSPNLTFNGPLFGLKLLSSA